MAYLDDEYIWHFDNKDDYESFVLSPDFEEPFVGCYPLNGDIENDPIIVKYNKDAEELIRIDNLKKTPLTFEIIGDGNIVWRATNTAFTTTIEYSKDSGQTWTSITATTDNNTTISVVSGDTVMFRGDNASYSSGDYINSFTGTNCRFNLKGNIMSLINSTNYYSLTALTGVFYTFFSWISGLIDASDLMLPATTLSVANCYRQMFYNCTGLTSAPSELPATTLSNTCYYWMFYNCSSLVNIPKILPASTLTVSCYAYMFYGCTSLDSVPVISATALANYCCDSMFSGCTSLTKIQSTLPATTMANSCYKSMFAGCTSLTTVPSNFLPATNLGVGNYCYAVMFDGCTSLTRVPALPATTLASYCYYCMFRDCTSLSTIPSDYLPATTVKSNCYNMMFYGCTGLTTMPVLSATTLNDACYRFMFHGCRSLVNSIEILPATTLTYQCYFGMFINCINMETAPALPATILAEQCYGYMLNGCQKLNYINCLATDISASNCTVGWVAGVQTVSGTFVKDASMTSWTTGDDGIPTNWTVQDAS